MAFHEAAIGDARQIIPAVAMLTPCQTVCAAMHVQASAATAWSAAASALEMR
jgi:hypothetical protein